MDNEIWKDVPNYEGYYMASNFGRLVSLVGWDGHRHVERKRIINGWIQKADSNGTYKRRIVTLTKEGIKEELKVHRIIALTFISNAEGKPNINHIDGNPLNNHVENLEWCTQKENNKHAVEMGLRRIEAYENTDEVIRLYKKGMSVREIAEKHSASNLTINRIIETAGIRIRNPGFYQEKYFIDKKELMKDFESGMRNVDIAKKHGTNRHLIGTYKHKYKRGLLL